MIGLLCTKNTGIKSVLTLWYGDSGVPRETEYVAESVDRLEGIILNMLRMKGMYTNGNFIG